MPRRKFLSTPGEGHSTDMPFRLGICILSVLGRFLAGPCTLLRGLTDRDRAESDRSIPCGLRPPPPRRHGASTNHFVTRRRFAGKACHENYFLVITIEDTQNIDDAFLAKYARFIQMNYHHLPTTGPTRHQASFIKYTVAQGKGGLIGVHTMQRCLEEFDGVPDDLPWFHQFWEASGFQRFIANFRQPVRGHRRRHKSSGD